MQSIGHPIVGDRVYGRPGGPADPGRPWLHARELAFEHPVGKGAVKVVAPLPTDLVDSLGALGDPDGDDVEIEGMDR